MTLSAEQFKQLVTRADLADAIDKHNKPLIEKLDQHITVVDAYIAKTRPLQEDHDALVAAVTKMRQALVKKGVLAEEDF